MRVNAVTSNYYRQQSIKRVKPVSPENNSAEVNFKGKFGRIVGGALGAGAVVTAALFFAAPAALCLTGAGLISGMIGGDVAEDSINKHDDK